MSGTSVAALALHALLMGGAAFVLAACLPIAQARFAGCSGPPLSQLWHDWQRMLRKRPTTAESSTPALPFVPGLCLVLSAAAALLVPSFTLGMATAPLSDLLAILGLLATTRLLFALAEIDAGTGAGGVAAVRIMRVTVLADPALLIIALAVALLAGTTNLDAACLVLRDTAAPVTPLLLTGAALGCVAIALDADAGSLEFSGWHQAAAQAAVALRRVTWLSLLAALLLPGGFANADGSLWAWPAGLAIWAVKMALLSAGCVLARRASPGRRILGAAALLVVLAILSVFAGQAPA